MPDTTIPDTLPSVTRDFQVGSIQGQVTVGFLPDGKPGLVLIQTEKQMPIVAALFQAVASLTTTLLQKGVPIEEINQLVRTTMFEPTGPSHSERVGEDIHNINRLFQIMVGIKPPPRQV